MAWNESLKQANARGTWGKRTLPTSVPSVPSIPFGPASKQVASNCYGRFSSLLKCSKEKLSWAPVRSIYNLHANAIGQERQESKRQLWALAWQESLTQPLPCSQARSKCSHLPHPLSADLKPATEKKGKACSSASIMPVTPSRRHAPNKRNTQRGKDCRSMLLVQRMKNW